MERRAHVGSRSPGAVFSYKLRYIVGFWLVEIAISTNQKPTIYRKLYENMGPVVECVIHALLMRYSHADSCWWSLTIESRIMWCAFFSRQSRYSNATRALTNARQSFWIMRVPQSSAFSIIFNIFPCVTRSLTVIFILMNSMVGHL